MKHFLALFLLCMMHIMAKAQSVHRLLIRNADEGTPLSGATVIWTNQHKSFVSDSNGSVSLTGVPDGEHQFTISFVGFEEKTITLRFPLSHSDPTIIDLEEEGHHEEEEVIVTTTRISRSIANIPTRVEVISGEELEEKANMKPGEIRMLLSESTGIQVQQTSATSFNAGIRIQGLDGRYTQILRDGYPLYAGFSGGLSIMQIAPLDLRQVEVIKGSASTLYGGGAIAGLVNLISKTPGAKREFSFLANGTSAGGLDLSGFYSERYGKAGLTVYASRNSNAAYDPADIGMTAIPRFTRYTVQPRLFLYGKKTTADVGVGYITEKRTGGSMDYIKNGGNGFFEKNNTSRITTQAGIVHRLNEQLRLQFKTSYSQFDRKITIPAYAFDALQQSSFSELTLTSNREKTDWVGGLNFITDDLDEKLSGNFEERDYHFKTYGVFLQNATSLSNKLTLESGLRADYVKSYGFEWLPRLSLLYAFNSKWSTRLGGGFGYKTPTIFTEETERRQFMGVLPIKAGDLINERSLGGNWDINFRTPIGDAGLTINHLFFLTRLNHPLALTDAGGGKSRFVNAEGHLDTKGMETNVRVTYSDFKLFLGYTYTDANTHFLSDKDWLPLTARNRINAVLMYEKDEKLKLGLEGYYFSRQKLNDGTMGKSYWITGFMAEKIWEHVSVYINFENFTNTRQSRFDKIFTGTIDNPVFRDIYAPVEGFVVNGGIKIRL